MIRMILLLLVALVINNTGACQQLDTQELLDVIKKWNFANNAGSEETFRELYADNVFFYAEALNKMQCVAAKREMLQVNPKFKQKIITDPVFTAQTSGVVKSQFTREIFESGRWRKVPTYLLISYIDNRYVITGESDFETDKKRKRQPRIGEPMELAQTAPGKSSERLNEINQSTLDTSDLNTSSVTIDSQSTFPEDTVQNDTVVTAAEDTAVLSSVREEVLSDETVAVPKKYVYLLIGFLVLTAVIVLLSTTKKKRNRRRADRVVADRSETTVIKNDKGFEGFVVALFDPHYFTVSNTKRRKVVAGSAGAKDFAPGLEIEFQNKDQKASFAIECIFIARLASQEMISFSAAQINRFHDFDDTFGTDSYIVIGFEGEPNDPKEVYLIPASELRVGVLRYPDLQPYRKHGMFFYNAAKQRLV